MQVKPCVDELVSLPLVGNPCSCLLSSEEEAFYWIVAKWDEWWEDRCSGALPLVLGLYTLLGVGAPPLLNVATLTSVHGLLSSQSCLRDRFAVDLAVCLFQLRRRRIQNNWLSI